VITEKPQGGSGKDLDSAALANASRVFFCRKEGDQIRLEARERFFVSACEAFRGMPPASQKDAPGRCVAEISIGDDGVYVTPVLDVRRIALTIGAALGMVAWAMLRLQRRR